MRESQISLVLLDIVFELLRLRLQIRLDVLLDCDLIVRVHAHKFSDLLLEVSEARLKLDRECTDLRLN